MHPRYIKFFRRTTAVSTQDTQNKWDFRHLYQVKQDASATTIAVLLPAAWLSGKLGRRFHCFLEVGTVGEWVGGWRTRGRLLHFCYLFLLHLIMSLFSSSSHLFSLFTSYLTMCTFYSSPNFSLFVCHELPLFMLLIFPLFLSFLSHLSQLYLPSFLSPSFSLIYIPCTSFFLLSSYLRHSPLSLLPPFFLSLFLLPPPSDSPCPSLPPSALPFPFSSLPIDSPCPPPPQQRTHQDVLPSTYSPSPNGPLKPQDKPEPHFKKSNLLMKPRV